MGDTQKLFTLNYVLYFTFLLSLSPPTPARDLSHVFIPSSVAMCVYVCICVFGLKGRVGGEGREGEGRGGSAKRGKRKMGGPARMGD